MASVRITFTIEEEYLVEYLRNKSKPNLFIKDLIKEAMYSEYYRLTGNVPSFFEKIADNSISLNSYSENQVDDLAIINDDEDEDDIGVDISDMEDF